MWWSLTAAPATNTTFANVRHILIQPEASELSEDDEGYEDDVAAKDAEAAQKAQDILDEGRFKDATEGLFALANEYPRDPRVQHTGGSGEQCIISDGARSSTTGASIPPARPATPASFTTRAIYQHVMYFVAGDRPYREIQVPADPSMTGYKVPTRRRPRAILRSSPLGRRPSFVGLISFTTQDVRRLKSPAGRFPPVCTRFR